MLKTKKPFRFESTYEELKPFIWRKPCLNLINVLSLPMRNWNIPWVLHSGRWASCVLSLPMRNWNFESIFEPTSATLRFESTYEELKRLSCLSCSDFCKRFESTYEELKLNSGLKKSLTALKFWVYLWGIETKILRNILFRAYWVLSLPMRNWNSSGQRMTSNNCHVLSLPMRNWNTEFLTHWTSVKAFWVYLWGIETLKLDVKKYYPSMFWVYLWGIETLSDMTRMYCDIRFWVYLWGIETSSDVGQRPTSDDPFWVYLWGIETEAVTSLPCILAGFWVYLWGIETCYFVTPISIEYWVLSLPMRNWNESKQHLSIYQWLCFESTYEELKLLITSGITSSPTSFESTYEELKLQPPSMILFPQPRFESTYEELKPGHGILR